MGKREENVRRRFQKWLDQKSDELHQYEYPEDAHGFKRPTDTDLAAFIDKFVDSYNWREDIHGDKMHLSVFRHDELWGTYVLTPKGQKKYDIIRWLHKNKYFSYINNHDGTVTVYAVDRDRLDDLEMGLHPEIIPAKVSYSPATNLVVFNGRRKQMQTGKNLKIFQYLVERPNERISKTEIWRLIGNRTSLKGATAEFSRVIANVRTSVGATREEIKLEGTVTLHAQVTLID